MALSLSLEDQNLQIDNKHIGFYRIIEGSEFNYEIKMDFGFSNTDISKFENSEQTELETEESFLFGIGISQGITFFAIESFAFEVQLDVLGYEYEKFKSIDEEGNEFTSDSHNVNFQIDLLSINFSLAYYFGAKKQ